MSTEYALLDHKNKTYVYLGKAEEKLYSCLKNRNTGDFQLISDFEDEWFDFISDPRPIGIRYTEILKD